MQVFCRLYFILGNPASKYIWIRPFGSFTGLEQQQTATGFISPGHLWTIVLKREPDSGHLDSCTFQRTQSGAASAQNTSASGRRGLWILVIAEHCCHCSRGALSPPHDCIKIRRSQRYSIAHPAQAGSVWAFCIHSWHLLGLKPQRNSKYSGFLCPLLLSLRWNWAAKFQCIISPLVNFNPSVSLQKSFVLGAQDEGSFSFFLVIIIKSLCWLSCFAKSKA